MVCMIPFDMARLDGNVKNEEQLVVHRIINQAKVGISKPKIAYNLSKEEM